MTLERKLALSSAGREGGEDRREAERVGPWREENEQDCGRERRAVVSGVVFSFFYLLFL